MADDAATYFMGDIYVGEVSFGFVLRDGRAEHETTLKPETARSLASSAGIQPEAPLGPANLYEISADEFEMFRDQEIHASELPEGVRAWQVKS